MRGFFVALFLLLLCPVVWASTYNTRTIARYWEFGYSVAVDSNLLYTGYFTSGYSIGGGALLDITNPAHAVTLRRLPGYPISNEMIGHGGCFYVPTSSSLMVVNATDPTTVTLRAAYGRRTEAVAICEGLLYLLTDKGLRICSMPKPDVLNQLGALDLPGSDDSNMWVKNLAVANGVACMRMFGEKNGICIVDVSNPRAPQTKSTVELPISFLEGDIALRDKKAYVLDSASKLFILDLSDPSSPKFCASVRTGPNGHVIGLSGDLLYAGGGVGTIIFNTRNPYAPFECGKHDVLTHDLAIYKNGFAFGTHHMGNGQLTVFQYHLNGVKDWDLYH